MSTRFVQFVQARRIRAVAGVALSVGLMMVLLLMLPFTGPASAEVSEADSGASVGSSNALRVTAARARCGVQPRLLRVRRHSNLDLRGHVRRLWSMRRTALATNTYGVKMWSW
jgi:hypothetical protein